MSDVMMRPSVPSEEKKMVGIKKRFTLFTMSSCIFLIVCGIGMSGIGYHIVSNRYHRDLLLARVGVSDLEAASKVFQGMPHDPFNVQAMYRAQGDFTDALMIFTRLNKDVPTVLTRFPIPRLRASKHLIQLAIEMAHAGQATCNILTTVASHFAHYPQIEQEGMHDQLAARVGILRGIYARMPKKSPALHSIVKNMQGFKMYDVVRLEQNLHWIAKALKQANVHIQQLTPADMRFNPLVGKVVGAIRLYLPLVQEGLRRAEAFIAVLPLIAGIGQPARYLIKIRALNASSASNDLVGSYDLTLVGGRLAAVHTHDTTTAGEGQLTGTVTITPALIERILAIHGPLAIPEYHEVITSKNLLERIHYHQFAGGDIPSFAATSSARQSFSTLLAIHFVQYLQSLPSSLLPTLLQVLAASLYNKDLQLSFTSPLAENMLQEEIIPVYSRMSDVLRRVDQL